MLLSQRNRRNKRHQGTQDAGRNTQGYIMKRLAIFAYGLACYAIFFATFLYAVGFIGNLWVPKAIDSPSEVSMGTALLVNLGQLALFAVQHSVMARPAF